MFTHWHSSDDGGWTRATRDAEPVETSTPAAPPPAPLPLVMPGRNWEAAMLMLMCVSAGIGALFKPAELLPNFERAMPAWIVFAWGVTLLIGGGIALVGTLLRPGPLSLLIWRVGLLPLAGACLAYPVELLLVGGTAAIERAVITLVFAFVVLRRIANITRVVRCATHERRSP